MVTQLVLGATFYWGNMVFYILSFVILMALILHFAWTPIVKMLDERATKISNDIDSAEQSRNEAAELAKQNKAALADSRSKASDIMTTAKQNGEQQRSKIVADAQDEATQYRQQARKDIEQERQDALKNAQGDVADLSIEIASKILQKELKPADQQALINSYIEGLGKHES